jgi:hypothetical protein
MRYPGDYDMTHMMGIGEYVGEVRQGPDGNVYQWVEGIDGLGNTIGFWKRLKRLARKAIPIAKRFARMSPVGRQAFRLLPIAKRIARSSPTGRRALQYLRRAGVSGYDGLGALYETPDGSIYQMMGAGDDEALDGLAAEEELYGLGQDDLTAMMGLGEYVGEIRQGPDGQLYQWMQGIDGLGNPIGFWKRLKKLGRRLKRGFKRIRKGARRVLRKALPLATTVTSFLPLPGARAAAAGLKVATPFLRRAGFAGYVGLGELYEAPDGTLYQVQGLAEEPDLEGLAEEYDLEGLADDYEDMAGFAQEYDLEGFAEDYADIDGLAEEYDLEGFADDYEDMAGLAEETDLEGLDQGYVQQDDMIYGVEGYVPHQRPTTRWFAAPVQAPKLWESPW